MRGDREAKIFWGSLIARKLEPKVIPIEDARLIRELLETDEERDWQLFILFETPNKSREEIARDEDLFNYLRDKREFRRKLWIDMEPLMEYFRSLEWGENPTINKMRKWALKDKPRKNIISFGKIWLKMRSK